MIRIYFTFEQIMEYLNSLADPDRVNKLNYFGSCPQKVLGIRTPELRALAKGRKDHYLAGQLWATGIHEARILASMVDDPVLVTREQMEAWTADFDAWDVCDQVCSNLFDRTPFAVEYALLWAEREEEYVRRAGFVMMAEMAIHREDLPDEVFFNFLPVIEKYTTDPRNFVRKAVNWALRQIGKQRPQVFPEAEALAKKLCTAESSTARWIGMDALRDWSAPVHRPKMIRRPSSH